MRMKRAFSVSRISQWVLLCGVGVTASACGVPDEGTGGDDEVVTGAFPVGATDDLSITGLVLDGEIDPTILELKRFQVWRPGATVEVDGKGVTPPATKYFRGQVPGEDDSVAVISIRATGEVQGIVQKGGKSWAVGKGRNHKTLRSKKADKDSAIPFDCGNDHALSPEERMGQSDEAEAATLPLSGTVLDQNRVANLAIDTDYEFFAKFGNVTAALDYIGDLVGYADVVYSREVKTDMQIGFSRLWTTDPDADPYAASRCVDMNGDGVVDNSPCGTSAALGELRTHWNANMTGVNRTLVHLLSGKGLGGGIAYVGTLCQNYYAKGGSNDYGVSASLGGNFNWDGNQGSDPATVVWDIVVLQHEIGHNFNSPHTHSYCNVGGSALPVDNCYAGCEAGATIEVPECSQPTPYFTSGSGAGTIMSYCHMRSGGYGNIAMTFGEGQPCGTKPERVPSRMRDHVTVRAAAYPSCFADSDCGNGVLDPGEQCDGINLGGASCGSQGFVGGTLKCSTTCTLDTAACNNCGNGTCESSETCGTCAVDCSGKPEICGNGIDDNCAGGTDCADAACSGLASCQCRAPRTACTANSQCCSGSCQLKGKYRNTCN